jgi:UDP-2,3-diacylglucosamine hydrolase
VAESERLKKLFSFLEYVAENGESLYIVGDLFDFWFEYKTVIPRGYMEILCHLNQLRQAGLELHYIAGNHDFWMRSFLSQEMKIAIHFDELTRIIHRKKFYIHHGDGLAEFDKGYRLLKRIFRNKMNIFLYSLIHPDLGIPLAKWISSLSRKHTEPQGEPDDSDYLKLAHQKFGEGFDYVIFGHLHSPRIKEFDGKVYLNLGDWIQHFSYAEFDGRSIKLCHWS